MASTKRILIDQLTVGMFIAGLDQPWYRTPFLLHKWLVSNPDDIIQLKRHGIQVVTIDTDRGLDVGAAPVGPEAAPLPEPPSAPEIVEAATAGHSSPAAAAAATYREAMEAVNRVFTDLEAGQLPKITALKPVVSKLLKQIVEHPEAMMIQFCLDKMRRFDGTLANHGMDVCVLTLILAVENSCTEDEMEALGLGALLHDIGFVRLPRNLYRKTSPLTEQEQVLMRQHPQLAATVLTKIDLLPEAVSHIIAQHHEFQDGSGYPKLVKPGGLSPLAQLMALADTYDDLVTSRYGRAPLLPHDAIRQLFVLGAKGRYDKNLVEVAIKMLGVYPLGSLIKLNTNECAVVIGLNHEDRLRPRIRIIRGPDGEIQSPPVESDLQHQATDQPARTILRALDPRQEQIDLPQYLDVAVGGA
ncbi:MAG: Putative Metal-dependent phosphohydrolase [Nitrospira sp.]|nr:MAG: Putative Metal-dependent phosphohydrolase [Nitrospira sp.]